jgi:protein-tyrosine phosphatase
VSPHIALEGNFNLRDLGGYEAVDGRAVKLGCLFRSDELHELTTADLGVIKQLGVRVVFDLRSELERERRPTPSLANVVVYERKAPARDPSGMTMEEKLLAGIAPAQASDEEFGAVYVSMLRYLRAELAHIVELAVDAAVRPLLFHCVAGKDRTGLTSAILLGLLGVPDETILDDYELTTALWTPRRMEQLADLIVDHDLDADVIRLMVSARRPVLATALADLHATWGTFDNYARSELGVADDVPDRLRANLLA